MPDPYTTIPDNLLLITTARINRLQDQVLASLDVPLTSRQYRVLARVHQGYDSPTSLARLARRSLPTLSETIEGLVKKGLLLRTPRSEDRRAVVLALTPAGEKAMRTAAEHIGQLGEELLQVLSPEDAACLARHLETLFTTAEKFLEARNP